ncbi:translational activator GCN1 [Coprinopsis marcescibilis]|uniref:Translational activator GCN1 n=1 Tax=Coprinopsis marcescibilis TaxID=230819 RepID=A0A5C3L280_COPMA|nr:translational activator GCN1 [Coprinopsis marcescibilis]
MSKSEIQSWISGTGSRDEDEAEDSEEGQGYVWRRDQVLNDWDRSMEYAQTRLLTDKTKSRVAFLKEEILGLAKHADLSLSQLLDAVEDVGMELVQRDESKEEGKLGVTEQILGWFSNEVGGLIKRGSADSYAPANLFVLHSWSCGLYTTCMKANPAFTSTNPFRVLVGSMAFLFDMINESKAAKPSLKHGVLIRTRRALRSAGNQVPKVIETLLGLAKTNPTPSRLVSLIGVSVSVLIRLKDVPEPAIERLPGDLKSGIVSLYTNAVVLSKTLVPDHILEFLKDFISTFVTSEDFEKSILPIFERSLIRSPELSLPPVIQFFSSYPRPSTPEIFKKLVTQCINIAKSSSAVVRDGSVALFKAILSSIGGDQQLEAVALTELLVLPKTSKTTGPDHRISLYSMLGLLIPSSVVSSDLVQSATPLLSKETNEIAISVLAAALPPHIVYILLNDEQGVPKETVQLIAKEMGNAKPAVRRAFSGLVGSVLSSPDIMEKDAGKVFAKAVAPSLENALKSVSANPINTPGGPLEGYVAVAVLLGPFVQSGSFDDLISKNPVLQAIVASSVKQSFLLWDKVYQKLSESEEEKWLLKAAEAGFKHFKTQIMKNEYLRTQFGLVFVHLAVESKFPEIRKLVQETLAGLTVSYPRLVNIAVREAIIAFIPQVYSKLADASDEDNAATWNKHARLSGLLLSCASFGDSVAIEERQELVSEAVIVAHHPLTCGPSRQTWIDLCIKASIDPLETVNKRSERLLELIRVATTLEAKSGFSEAAYAAAATLAFISPSQVLPDILKQIEADLDPRSVDVFTDLELGVWATPPDTTYVDVLSNVKTEQRVTKGKDAAIAKWEEETRKSIASKKSQPATLTKQQEAAVKKQLEVEAGIRQTVAKAKTDLERGCNLVKSLVSSGASELGAHVTKLAELLVNGPLKNGSFLAGQLAFQTYMDLASLTSDRLDTYKSWVGVAALRCHKVAVMPEELQVEALGSLVLRVLYRLRSLSEQTPLDAPSFSYAFPLLQQVLLSGGIEVEDEERLEQVTLALSIIKFHAGEFDNPELPRLQTLEAVIYAVRTELKLSKEASSTLVDLGESIQVNATRGEIGVLIRATLAQESHARNAALQALQPFDLTEIDWSPELWIAYHDNDEQNARLAQRLWEENGLDVADTFLNDLLPYLGHDNAYVRSSTATAIATAVEQLPNTAERSIEILEEYYRENAKILAPEFDQYGMVIASSLDRSDPWPARLATAHTFEKLAEVFPVAHLEPFFNFLIQSEALGDRDAEVRKGMLNAGTAVIDLHGSERLAALISIFESQLSRPSTTETGDHIKEAVVILFGRVARHLDASDDRIPKIVDRLVEALKTPSEQVQIAVSECISPIVNLMQSRLSSLVDQLFEDLFRGEKYAVRRGAAYGIAGVIKGTGISGMKDYDVLRRLHIAAEDKKNLQSRQGVVFVLETLSSTLGRLFEPYITHVLPLLLSSFGDSTADVREGTQDAARIIMGNLSGYGVKLILPTLLEGLDEKQWRSKKGSIELLGMMAYCSPRQLSVSLPVVIPRLTGVLTDSHAQVRISANKSLKQFGEVISNPEIQAIVPVLLKALVDPTKTPNALSHLLKTSFMHYIDHSSLALVIPIVERGLRERGAETKKKAVQIVGNLASLTDTKDFVPYLDELLPLVHVVLVDPVPEARATAAKSLGTLVERLGEIHFPDLVPGLLRTLKTDSSGVDRQGAAQGLSEVLAALGMERLEGLLPDILANSRSPRATVREGFMSLLVFLPATFGTRFSPHLPKIIPPILSGLSDSEEYVREAAMRAGRMVVNNYSHKAIDLLLPELESGMFDPNWRIRQSSITLVGELLFKVSGISGKTSDGDEEDNAEATVVESSRRALLEVLGAERRDHILAALYLVRQDGVVVVRQASIQIWKALVNNTPRTVREILAEVVSFIIFLISSDEPEQEETAARTVGELCRKFGERILGEIIPLLKTKSTSADARTRQGVSTFISEILQSASETQREDYEDDIISIVRVSLVDDEANVRAAAAQAFDIMQSEMGVKAIDETIPTLLEALRQPGKGSGTALQALQEVMSVRSTTVFPVLIPTLIAIPMTVFNARALASLVTVAGNALSRRLTVIMNALVKVMESSPEAELAEAVDEALEAILASIEDAEGLNTLMMLLMGWAKDVEPKRRVSACNLFAKFCEVSELDSSLYRTDWIRQLVTLFEDENADVHKSAWSALDTFVKSLPKDELEPLVVPLRRSIESTGTPGQTVPGFNLPKGVSPTVPIIIAGLTTGSNEQREQAAYAIGDLVERTDEAAFKPFVVPFTGPLIRVATQATAYPPGVKIGILSALTTMLERIPVFLKPFFPQLQRTFVKSASDGAAANVRSKAARGLGILMKHQPRVDPVITELITTIKASGDDSVVVSLVHALAFVVASASANVGEKAREACLDIVTEAFRGVNSEKYSEAIGNLIVALSDKPEQLESIVESHLVTGTPLSSLSSYVILAVLDAQVNADNELYTDYEPNLFQKLGLFKPVAQKALESAASDKPVIARPAREARDIMKDMHDESLRGLF